MGNEPTDGTVVGSAGSVAASGTAPGSGAVESNRGMPDVCSGWWTPRPGYASKSGFSARRAQAIATVTRLDGDRLRAPVGEAD